MDIEAPRLIGRTFISTIINQASPSLRSSLCINHFNLPGEVVMSSNEISSATSLVGNSSNQSPLCHCSRQTSKSTAWTDENPGGRYYNCEEHGFVCWIDKEKPCLWQKRSLLEARDQNRQQTYEIKALREAIGKANAELAALELSRSTIAGAEFFKTVEAIVKEQTIESNKQFRRFVVSSWGGFFLATAVLVYVFKN